MVEEIGDPFAVFGTDRGGLAEAEGEAFEDSRIALAAFGLVGHQHHGYFLPTQPACDFLVERRQAEARIEDK